MPALRIELQSGDANLTAVGAVYRRPVHAGDKPLVADVIAGNGRASLMTLESGEHEYHFHIENGRGAFTLRVLQDPDLLVFQKDYDTAAGVHGRVLRFRLP